MDAQVATQGGIRGVSRTRLGTLLVMGATTAVILAVAFAVNQPTKDPSGLTSVTVSSAATGSAPEVGKPAPDFLAVTSDGTTVQLSALKGMPVWLTFGASWCQPCRAENPDIIAMATKYEGRVQVVQVFLSEDAATVADYAKRVGITYLKVPDPNTDIAAEYRILGIPSHFFIDATGTMQAIKVGSLDPSSMEAALAGVVK